MSKQELKEAIKKAIRTELKQNSKSSMNESVLGGILAAILGGVAYTKFKENDTKKKILQDPSVQKYMKDIVDTHEDFMSIIGDLERKYEMKFSDDFKSSKPYFK